MSRLAWLTSDLLPTADFICRRIRIPNDIFVIANVNGALLSLCEQQNWEKFGAVTIAETVTAMNIMYDEYSQGEACLIGAILPYATLAVPSGCLPCDGTQYLREDYPMLYAALDTIYIVDADNFKTPDLQGRTIIGSGEGTDLTIRSVGDVDGEESHVLVIAELAAHDHTTQPHSHDNTPHAHSYNHPSFNIDVESAGVPDPFAVGQPMLPIATSATSIFIGNADVTVDPTGDDEPHNNMQPFHALRYCIVAR